MVETRSARLSREQQREGIVQQNACRDGAEHLGEEELGQGTRHQFDKDRNIIDSHMQPLSPGSTTQLVVDAYFSSGGKSQRLSSPRDGAESEAVEGHIHSGIKRARKGRKNDTMSRPSSPAEKAGKVGESGRGGRCVSGADLGRAKDCRKQRRTVSEKRDLDKKELKKPRIDKSQCGAIISGKKRLESAVPGERTFPSDASKRGQAVLSGYLGQLPHEALEHILGYLGPAEIGLMETTCRYFLESGIIEQVARHNLRSIPRAKGLTPMFLRGETYVTLFKFVMGQSKAAAQGTGIALGSYHSIGLLSKSDGESPDTYAMYAFGRGFHGQLGQGAHESQSVPHRIDEVDRDGLPVQLYTGKPGDINLAVVNAGSSHTTAISRRGELFTWGLASSGELGHGGWTPIEVPVPRMVSNLGRTRIVSVCAGDNHTLAISESGQLWSCGRGRHGQLGHGHFHDEGMMTLISSIHRERIVSVSAGKAHSIALAADGKLFTWGDASHGQLGHNQLLPLVGDNRQPIAIPFPQAITSLDPTKLQPPERVTAIAAGGNHSMAVTVGGSLLAFGSNSSGQLGLGDTENRFTPTKVPLVGKGGAAVRAVQVQCGAAHSILLAQRLGRMEVKTVGDNSYGQLGHGDLVARRQFATINGLTSKKIMCVSSGDFHVAAIDESGKLYTWGRGDCGQLGHGDDKSRWTPKLLEDFSVVHPDRTLRRNRKKVSKPLILSGTELEKMSEVGRGPNNPYRPSWSVAMF